MEKVRSKEDTTVACDRLGDRPTVLVVGGATCDRAMTRPLAEQLARRFTVINYDRRGSGDAATPRHTRSSERSRTLVRSSP